MGKPVSIEVKTAADGSREVNACFFLPERIQADPPTPTDPLVFLSQRPTLTIFTTYVREREKCVCVCVKILWENKMIR
ncbi:hypothetical protein E2C01_083285 [Portunus trituberculatus]|uniref:Uncharacterized protein n=1 Tax=Portunus trituberculatus TaxID=210409 RepID=A0A5B7J7F1_PORTR|nr:hypothetical protein [Portunus trituberculatus]